MWTKQWPTTTGFYWFYGWCFRDRDRPPEYNLVKVVQGGNGLFFVTNGHFLYKAEGGDGFWCEAQLPEPPEMK